MAWWRSRRFRSGFWPLSALPLDPRPERSTIRGPIHGVHALVLELHGYPDATWILQAASRDPDRHRLVVKDVGAEPQSRALNEPRSTIPEEAHASYHLVEAGVGSEVDVVVRTSTVASVDPEGIDLSGCQRHSRPDAHDHRVPMDDPDARDVHEGRVPTGSSNTSVSPMADAGHSAKAKAKPDVDCRELANRPSRYEHAPSPLYDDLLTSSSAVSGGSSKMRAHRIG